MANRTGCNLLSDYLMGLGHDVITAGNGEEALAKFIPGGFDCVISIPIWLALGIILGVVWK